MSRKSAPISYEEAQAELQRILQALQEETISVDELAAQVARAGELLKICQERLRDTEAAIQAMLE